MKNNNMTSLNKKKLTTKMMSDKSPCLKNRYPHAITKKKAKIEPMNTGSVLIPNCQAEAEVSIAVIMIASFFDFVL